MGEGVVGPRAAGWIAEELRTLRLGDERLHGRAAAILRQQERLGQSNTDAAKDEAALEGLYRFVKNRRVGHDKVLAAHNAAVLERCRGHSRVILAQDTTLIDLTKPRHQVRGAGPLESESKRGFFVHPLYAVTEEGLVLGVIDQVIWTRESIRTDLTENRKRALNRDAFLEEKESGRWLEMLQSADQIARACPGTHFVCVSDSESDVYELLEEAAGLAPNCDFVIRACQDRTVLRDGGPAGGVPAGRLGETLAAAAVLAEAEVAVSARACDYACKTKRRQKPRESRTARLSVRSSEVTLAAPRRPGGRGPDAPAGVRLWAVRAAEADPPAGAEGDAEEPVDWVLLTTRPAAGAEAARRVLAWYGLRWTLEEYFKTLKSGLNVEKLKYESIERYVNAASLLMITAYRVEHLKTAARVTPGASCETVVSADFWLALWLVRRGGAPAGPPSVGEFVTEVARMGGYRKSSPGPPGSMTLWRGLRTADAYHEAFLAYRSLRGDV